MKKALAALALVASIPAYAVDFTTAGSPSSFNSTVHNTVTVGGIIVDAFTYSAGTFTSSMLWLRNDGPTSGEWGFGICSEGTNCGSAGVTGKGDWNELSNNVNDEVIRLTRPDNTKWSDLLVSSLDTGGTNSNESGVLYSSNSATLSLTGGASFSHNAIGVNYGSIWSNVSGGIDPNAKYLFFRADPTNGTNNDYLVWGASVTGTTNQLPVPEPETYAMLLAGVGLLGFVAKRRKLKIA